MISAKDGKSIQEKYSKPSQNQNVHGLPFEKPPQVRDLGYFRPMKIVKPASKINLVTDTKDIKKSENRKSEINAVKNLPSFGGRDSSESLERTPYNMKNNMTPPQIVP